MPNPSLLVTASSGLIGSEVCVHFAQRGWRVVGVDNNQHYELANRDANPHWIALSA